MMPKGRQKRLAVLGQAPVQAAERKDAARNRARILDAARRLLRERPIQDICMDELARAAGVGKGTLYRRFADRASLCHALLNEEATALQNRVLDGLGLPLDAAWLLRIDRLLDAIFDFVHDNAPLLAEAVAFERGKTARFAHPAHVWQRDALVLYLSKAIEAQEITALDPEPTAEFILAGLDPDLMQWHKDRGFDQADLKARFRRFWREGVVGSAQPPR